MPSKTHIYLKFNEMSSLKDSEKVIKAYKQTFCLQRNETQIDIIIFISNAECHVTIKQCLQNSEGKSFWTSKSTFSQIINYSGKEMTLERYRDSKLLLCKYFLKYCLWISKRKTKKKRKKQKPKHRRDRQTEMKTYKHNQTVLDQV